MDCSGSHNDRGPAVKARMGQIRHKIIVLSGKGGVGKSTVAVNLATSLALEGRSVGLLDVDLHGPTVPQLLGLKGAAVETVGETFFPVQAGPNLKVMSIGFLLGEEDGAVVWRGPMKAVAIEQLLGEVEWGDLDYLIIDSPPGTGDEPLAVCQAIGDVDGAIIVTTPQETALANVRRSVKFCSLLELPVLGVIENMSGFVCPHCGEVTHIFSKGGGEAMAAKARVPFLASVPLDPRIVQAGDTGRPYIHSDPEGAAAQEFAKAVLPILALDEGNGHQDSAAAVKTTATAHVAETGAAAVPSQDTSLPDGIVRFAVPVNGGILSAHFGHCQEFALVDTDSSTRAVVGTTMVPAPEHEPGLLPGWLADRGAHTIIAGGMGSRAQQLFAERGLTVVTGAPAGTPEEIVALYLTGSLQTGDNVCDH